MAAGGALGASSSMLKWGRHAWRRGGQWLVLGRGVGPRGQQQDEDEDAVQDGGWALAAVMALVVKKPKWRRERNISAASSASAPGSSRRRKRDAERGRRAREAVDMATQVHVFISGMSAGYQRFYLTRKT
ncbi:hypothetical protein PHYSODRAFT_341009 [Phytophthora sojae]|uniref:Uncharacterized protein n=1 Tax=Phytophthora sojae (strain P6497) TaxID=1094619 RepID=G5ABV5_PHYSP|nr:hypothetical protein PHYSODRAFT_341009 [Phytophthora sojae]EGZ06830.1 hypothetical protein PHYSODRAFT_341009 [Phytophthora sojae]|eukprot:XP_009537594.1 hypothetical protein PHYSODRAFT_341009 [Phytophthora sojae]